MNKRLYSATAALMGCTIGAGILAIPFIVAQVGFLIGALTQIFIAIIVIFTSLIVAEIIQRTKGQHHFGGLANRYIGKNGKSLVAISLMITIYAALTAYTFGSGEAIYGIVGGNKFIYSLLFIILFSILSYFDIKTYARTETILTTLFLVVLFIIAILALPKTQLSNLTYNNWSLFYLPYGVILFATLGIYCIPEVQCIAKTSKNLKNSIYLAVTLSSFLYILFTFIVLGLLGKNTPHIATLGLGQAFGPIINILTNIFAVLAMGTTFIALSYALKDLYIFDYKIPHFIAWLLTISVPLLLLLLNITTFVSALSLGGAIGGGLLLISILLMHSNAKKYGDKKPQINIKYHPIISVFLISLFIVGMLFIIYSSI